MQSAYTVLILLTLVSLSKLLGRMIPLPVPLPLVQIAAGALLAWPTLGLHVALDPELFLFLFLPPLLFVDAYTPFGVTKWTPFNPYKSIG